jgi:hypothetical protein
LFVFAEIILIGFILKSENFWVFFQFELATLMRVQNLSKLRHLFWKSWHSLDLHRANFSINIKI